MIRQSPERKIIKVLPKFYQTIEIIKLYQTYIEKISIFARV
jgi:hypothetical protein